MGIDDDNRFFKAFSIHEFSDDGGGIGDTDGWGGSIHSSIWGRYGGLGYEEIRTLGTAILLKFEVKGVALLTVIPRIHLFFFSLNLVKYSS